MTQTTWTICVSNLKRSTDPTVLFSSKLRSTYESHISHRRTLTDARVTYSYKDGPAGVFNIYRYTWSDSHQECCSCCCLYCWFERQDSWREQLEVNVAVGTKGSMYWNLQHCVTACNRTALPLLAGASKSIQQMMLMPSWTTRWTKATPGRSNNNYVTLHLRNKF